MQSEKYFVLLNVQMKWCTLWAKHLFWLTLQTDGRHALAWLPSVIIL